jgi:hypothetical protein
MNLTVHEAEAMLQEWGSVHGDRDSRIALALAAGLTITKVADLMGLSRQTVYRSCRKLAGTADR